jgi:hypothetical protein
MIFRQTLCSQDPERPGEAGHNSLPSSASLPAKQHYPLSRHLASDTEGTMSRFLKELSSRNRKSEHSPASRNWDDEPPALPREQTVRAISPDALDAETDPPPPTSPLIPLPQNVPAYNLQDNLCIGALNV